MLIEVLKSKIHRVQITESDLDYVGSIEIDKVLMEAANIIAGEKVQVLNINNGARLETYVIEGAANSGRICLNGPAARLGLKGDTIIIVSYAHMTPEEARTFEPTVIFPENNQIK